MGPFPEGLQDTGCRAMNRCQRSALVLAVCETQDAKKSIYLYFSPVSFAIALGNTRVRR